MRDTHSGVVHATADLVEVLFDKVERKAAPIPDYVRDLLSGEADRGRPPMKPVRIERIGRRMPHKSP